MMAERKFRLPKEIPLDEYPKPEVYLEEARHLTEEAQRQGMLLRVMGPIALHFYFPDFVDLYRRMERLGERVFTDIDYASYGKFRNKMVPFFDQQGYDLEKRAAMISGGARLIFFGGRVPMIDVFYDKLDYNHPIDYRGRLELHPHCVSLTDLLLQKLQIVQINDKDLKDGMLLLLAAKIGETDEGMINARYVAKLMSEDWGFCYTSVMNLAKIQKAVDGVRALNDAQRARIREQAALLLKYIEEAPKSGGWKNRAKVGTKKPWYKEVADWE
jgi:hypothetical protein